MINIRRALLRDAETLAAFASRTYAQTFGVFTNPCDLEEFLATQYGTRQQRAEISSSEVQTLIVELEGQMIGYAQVRRGPVPECVSGESPVELWRFYIDGPWHGKGAAQDLMQAAKESAFELGGRTLWLGVWEENGRAIAFYTRQGFRIVGTKDFWVGKDCQKDQVMVCDLTKYIEIDRDKT
jgi:ribosomal protein S18 acetylase RimI-like enzyme